MLDGRDIGTVIFPDALVKLFVTPRCQRARSAGGWSFAAKGVEADPADVEAEMLARDTRDAPNMQPARTPSCSIRRP